MELLISISNGILGKFNIKYTVEIRSQEIYNISSGNEIVNFLSSRLFSSFMKIIDASPRN